MLRTAATQSSTHAPVHSLVAVREKTWMATSVSASPAVDASKSGMVNFNGLGRAEEAGYSHGSSVSTFRCEVFDLLGRASLSLHLFVT